MHRDQFHSKLLSAYVDSDLGLSAPAEKLVYLTALTIEAAKKVRISLLGLNAETNSISARFSVEDHFFELEEGEGMAIELPIHIVAREVLEVYVSSVTDPGGDPNYERFNGILGYLKKDKKLSVRQESKLKDNILKKLFPDMSFNIDPETGRHSVFQILPLTEALVRQLNVERDRLKTALSLAAGNEGGEGDFDAAFDALTGGTEVSVEPDEIGVVEEMDIDLDDEVSSDEPSMEIEIDTLDGEGSPSNKEKMPPKEAVALI